MYSAAGCLFDITTTTIVFVFEQNSISAPVALNEMHFSYLILKKILQS